MKKEESEKKYPETKLQYASNRYSTTIPKEIVEFTDVARKDKIVWRVKYNNVAEAIVEIKISKEGFRLPLRERIDGR